jgi:hypothetical protein
MVLLVGNEKSESLNMSDAVRENPQIFVIKKTTELIRSLKSRDSDKIHGLLAEVETRLNNCEPSFASRQRDMLQTIRAKLVVEKPRDNKKTTEKISSSEKIKNLTTTEVGDPIKPGLSLVTCCMNRSENLMKALRSWIACPQIDQIVIVDWSSQKSLHEELAAAGLLEPRVLVVRVEGQPRWILSYAYNLGFRVASRERILKTDADIIIEPEFFRANNLPAGTFLSGDWRTAGAGQEHVNGFFMIRREDLMLVKGFNEYITTYGWDDDDLYFRLEQRGFNRVRIKLGEIHHIPHGNDQRIHQQSKGNAWEEMLGDPGMKIMSNKFIAAVSPEWDQHKYFVPFDFNRKSPHLWVCQQKHESWHRIPDHVREDANHYGAALALSWSTDHSALFITKPKLRALLEARSSRADISRWDARLAALSPQTVNWQPRLLIVRFAKEVREQTRLACLKEARESAIRCAATLLLDSADRGLLEELDNSHEPVKTVLPVPDLYNLADIPEVKLSSLSELDRIFQDHPCALITLSAKQAASLLQPASRAKLPRTPKLILDAQHGLGNRIRALGSAAAVARATGRELILLWAPDHHCNCAFSDLFQNEMDVVDDPSKIDLRNADAANYMMIEPGARKDAPVELRPGRDFYIRSAYVLNHPASTWDEENILIRELRPVQAVQDLIDSVDSRGRLGVHVRFEGARGTDTNSYDSKKNWLAEEHKAIIFWREKSEPARFMARIDALLAGEPLLKVFLAADRPETYAAFYERYSSRLSVLPRALYDRSTEAERYALADALLLSQCSYLLGSTWSSFTEMVQRFSASLKTVEMSGVDF